MGKSIKANDENVKSSKGGKKKPIRRGTKKYWFDN